jgi:predicted nucleotidyltransferase
VLTEQEIGTLVSRLAASLNPTRIVIFGSYAKGTATAASDLDVMVIIDTPVPREFRSAMIAPFIAGYSVPIDAHVYTPDEVEALGAVEYSFMHAVVRTGRVVFDSLTGGRKGPQ